MRDLYQPPEWAVTTEVQVPRGAGRLRFIDVIALNTFGKGHEAHGFEVKVSRADWLDEVKKPDKARPGMEHVDKWFLVAGSPDLFRDGEVPKEWGIITPDANGKLIVIRPASYLRKRGPAEDPWPRDFMANILNRFTAGIVPANGLIHRVQREAEEKGYKKGYNAAKERKAPTQRAAPEERKLRYDPARYNFDDGIPLDLP